MRLKRMASPPTASSRSLSRRSPRRIDASVTLSISSETFSRFDRLSFVTRRPARAGLGGEHRSRRRAPSTDFVDYRPYSAGDDFRRIDWNVYGRLGALQVKVTEGRERLHVVVVL